MNIYLQLLLLAWIVVFIVDLSGVTDELARALKRDRLRKPFSCSLCMTWWTGLAWALIAGQFTWGVIAYIAALAWASSLIRGIALCIFENVNKLINKLS